MNSQSGKPESGSILDFDHLTFWVSNAKQAASYYVTRFGLEPLAFKGLETGSRKEAAHVVKLNKIIFVFKSQYEPEETLISKEVAFHGDFVKDVAFSVDNLDLISQHAGQQGAVVIRDLWEEKDEFGVVRMAVLKTNGDITHTLVDRTNYTGLFLPGYQQPNSDPINTILPKVEINFIDHVVEILHKTGMEEAACWYEKCLQFNRFWSDDQQVCIVVANRKETVMMTLSNVVPGKRSQVQEFVEYHGGAGVQHIAVHTDDIITAIQNLRSRGVEFLSVPPSYYEHVREKLSSSKLRVAESIDLLEQLNILIDFDEVGYLLQIFTKNTQDRPTLFIEVIQRRNHKGFGAGNFKALFECVELEKRKRGNL